MVPKPLSVRRIRRGLDLKRALIDPRAGVKIVGRSRLVGDAGELSALPPRPSGAVTPDAKLGGHPSMEDMAPASTSP